MNDLTYATLKVKECLFICLSKNEFEIFKDANNIAERFWANCKDSHIEKLKEKGYQEDISITNGSPKAILAYHKERGTLKRIAKL